MKKIAWGFLFFTVSVAFAQDREVEYIQKHALLAVEEMGKYKIPASITLAQGILETGGGQSRLAEQANNHFGIKCKKEWTGETITHDDDAPGECFRKYNSVRESYEDHSKFLAERPYYKNLFKLNPTDYKAWAHGLKKAGYATNPRYAYILISKIEKHHLQDFDKIQPNDVYDKVVALYGDVSRDVVDPQGTYAPKEEILIAEESTPTSPQDEKVTVVVTDGQDTRAVRDVKKSGLPTSIRKKESTSKPIKKVSPKERILRHPNGKPYIVVEKGETLKSISNTYDISIRRLMRFNDLEDANKLIAGQYLFLKRKRNKGQSRFYTVKPGDTMYLIAQKTGIKLKKLYCRNRMEEGEQANVGDVLYLRGRKPRN